MNISDRDEALRSTARLARLTFSAAAASVFIYHPDKDVLVFEAASGEGEDRILGMEVPARRGIVGWVTETGEPILVREVSEDERFNLEVAAETGYIPNVIMAIPIIQNGEITGVVEVLDPALRGMSDIAALDMLSELANQAALLLSMVPRQRADDDLARTSVLREFEAVVSRLPATRMHAVSRLIAAIGPIVE